MGVDFRLGARSHVMIACSRLSLVVWCLIGGSGPDKVAVGEGMSDYASVNPLDEVGLWPPGDA